MTPQEKTKEQRLAEALRENLKRRKVQSRVLKGGERNKDDN